jgi:predicted DNA-binding mobile mystery protein A
MNSRWLTIQQLDRQLKEWQAVSQHHAMPRVGWVKTIRAALNMSVEQLAHRLGVKRGRVSQLEEAEVRGAVTLHALSAAAEALGCEFVYAIVPKRSTTLESIIKTRAEAVAAERIAAVAHTMSLEAQTVEKEQLQKQKMALVKNLVETFNKKLWVNPIEQKKNTLAESLAKHLNKKK